MVDYSKYKKMFIDETLENISKINETISILEQNSNDQDAIQTLFRSFHSIKGMSASMSYRQVQEVSHKLEDLLDGLRNKKIECTKEVLDVLYDGTDVLEKMVILIEDDSKEKIDTSLLLNRLISISTLQPSPAELTSSSPPDKKETSAELSQSDLTELSKGDKYGYKLSITISKESISPPARAYLLVESFKEKTKALKTLPPMKEIEEGNFEREFTVYLGTELTQAEIESIISSSVEIERFSVTKIEVAMAERSDEPKKLLTRSPAKEDKGKTVQHRKPGTVKVDTTVLDNLIDIVGEMFIQENQLQDLTRSLNSPATIESVNQLEKSIKKLYKEVMKLRLVPISLLTDMIPRIMRDVLRNSDKKVELDIKGKDIKLDRSIIEKLGDPVIHLIRNSLDHGIESPEERKESGKPESAKINFSVTREKDSIKIELSDDGRGLNSEKLKEKAIATGLATHETIKKADLAEIYNYIWQPGFSTAKQVTSVSGRGVGMDIVKNVIEGLSGKVSVTSNQGQGCKFQLQVPMTIAIIKTFRIKLDQDIYAIPIVKVLHTVKVKKNDLKKDSNRLYFYYRDEKIPVNNLKAILQYGSNGINGKKEVHVVIVEAGGYDKVGLIVDSFLSVYDTVVKPLGSPLERLEILSGATISEKGELILILDVDKILRVKEPSTEQ